MGEPAEISEADMPRAIQIAEHVLECIRNDEEIPSDPDTVWLLASALILSELERGDLMKLLDKMRQMEDE